VLFPAASHGRSLSSSSSSSFIAHTAETNNILNSVHKMLNKMLQRTERPPTTTACNCTVFLMHVTTLHMVGRTDGQTDGRTVYGDNTALCSTRITRQNNRYTKTVLESVEEVSDIMS